MRSARLWARLLGVEDAVIQRVWFDEQAEAVVVAARPRKHLQGRCGRCGRRCRGVDRGEGRRRWRALEVGLLKAFVEADAPGVGCPEHPVVVAAVPWARHGAGHTRTFDDTTAWLAAHPLSINFWSGSTMQKCCERRIGRCLRAVYSRSQS